MSTRREFLHEDRITGPDTKILDALLEACHLLNGAKEAKFGVAAEEI